MAARLFVVRGDVQGPTDIELTPDRLWSVGRDASNELVILDDQASRFHCRLVCENGKWFAEDLGSRNGTFIHGERISRRELAPGDAIAVAATRLRFETDESAAAAVPNTEDDSDNVARIVVLDERGEATHSIGLSRSRPFSIGRTVDNDLMLETARASRRHCHVEFREGQWYLVDDSSRNGTYVDGVRVRDHLLRHKQVFRIGGLYLRFENDEDPESTLAQIRMVGPPQTDIIAIAPTGNVDGTGTEDGPRKPLTVHLILSRLSVTDRGTADSEDNEDPLESPTHY